MNGCPYWVIVVWKFWSSDQIVVWILGCYSVYWKMLYRTKRLEVSWERIFIRIDLMTKCSKNDKIRFYEQGWLKLRHVAKQWNCSHFVGPQDYRIMILGKIYFIHFFQNKVGSQLFSNTLFHRSFTSKAKSKIFRTRELKKDIDWVLIRLHTFQWIIIFRTCHSQRKFHISVRSGKSDTFRIFICRYQIFIVVHKFSQTLITLHDPYL